MQGGSQYFFADGEIVSSPKPIQLVTGPRPGIVFGTSLGQIYVLKADGTVSDGWPVASGSQVGYSSVAIADLDADGSEDIVVHSNNAVEAYRQDGSPLPGWPRTLDSNVVGNSIFASPVVADVDDNGDMEIVVGHFQRMYAFHHDGTTVTGWPILQSHPFGPLYSTPAVGDLDGDGDLEICFKIYGGNGAPADIYVLHHTGAAVAGWPKLGLDRSHLSSPVLADIDGDGVLDVVVSLHFFSGGNYVRLYVWRVDGSNVTGFPVAGSWNTAPEGMSVGDIDGDGFAEILVSTSNYTSPYYAVHAWNHDGSVVAGSWPRSAPFCLQNSSPALADVNGGLNEVIVGVGGCYVDDKGMMNVWANDGTAPPTWPRLVTGWLRSSPLVIDSDGDGVQEVFVGSSDGWIHRFVAESPSGDGSPEWDQAFHDRRNTNRYDPVEATNVADASEPNGFSLSSPRPNPLRDGTTLLYDIPGLGTNVKLSVYDLSGRWIVDLVGGFRSAGQHSAMWAGTDARGAPVGAGVYWARLDAGRQTRATKIVVTR